MSGKRAARVENVTLPVSALVPHSRNYNRHSDAQINDLRESLRQFGQVRSIVVQPRGKKFVIVAGHGIAQAAQAEGFTQLRADVIPASWSETRVLAYLAADNELARHGDPDQDQLAAIVREVMETEGEALARLAAGEQSALDAILAQANKQEETADVSELIDKAAELQKKWKVERGDVWEIESKTARGKVHRLMCGDSTSAADVAKLMGGEKAKLFATDPPYGIDYDSAALHRNETHFDAIGNDELKNEKYQSWLESVFNVWKNVLAENCAWYLWHPMLTQGYFAAAAAAAAAGVIISRQIIWVKPQFIFGRGHYHWMHELCFYGWRKGKMPPMYGERNQTTIWKIDYAGERNKRDHPTAKPPALWYAPMQNHVKAGELCAEPFSGSGAQLVAGENQGRAVYAMELAEKYCSVALERLSLLGLTPHRVMAGDASRRSDTTKRGQQAQTKAAPQKQNTSRRPLAVDSGT